MARPARAAGGGGLRADFEGKHARRAVRSTAERRPLQIGEKLSAGTPHHSRPGQPYRRFNGEEGVYYMLVVDMSVYSWPRWLAARVGKNFE